MNNKEYISNQVTRLQASNRLYDDAICDVLEIHRTTFYKKKRGVSSFKKHEIELLAELFNVDIEVITNPDYKESEQPAQKLAEQVENYVPVHEPQERKTTITLSVEVPLSGGLNIPEDITEQIIKIIENNN
jgi:hypothetical protein